MKDFWEAKYSDTEYVYGKNPNNLFKSFIDNLSPGKILLPADGEGRNAVYAAKKGWDVIAFDLSENAKDKATKLAEDNDVNISFIVGDLFELKFMPDEFDVIGIFYLHLPPETRFEGFKKIISYLKPTGKFVMEVFHKEQINNTSGGPKVLDLLYETADIEKICINLKDIKIEKLSVILDEGYLHSGKAEVIRAVSL